MIANELFYFSYMCLTLQANVTNHSPPYRGGVGGEAGWAVVIVLFCVILPLLHIPHLNQILCNLHCIQCRTLTYLIASKP